MRLLLLIIIGMGYIIYSWMDGINKTKEQAVKLARIVEAGLHSEEIAALEASFQDINKKEYIELKHNMTRFVTINSEVRFAYIYTIKEGKIYFIVDSEQEYSSDYSPPGQEYTEAEAIFYEAAGDNGKVIVTDTKDRWGSFKSVLVPIENTKSGKTVAVFGLDYTMKHWYQIAQQKTLIASFVVACILLLFFASQE